MIYDEDIINNCKVILKNCGDLKPDENVLIITDQKTSAIGEIFYSVAVKYAKEVVHMIVPDYKNHGNEPPDEVFKKMLKSNLICGLTSMSIAQSEACRKASLAGIRYLSLPDYSFNMLKSQALSADFRSLTQEATYLADAFTSAHSIKLLTENGTSLYCEIEDRIGNAAPGWCFAPGIIASPPDSEANIAVIEDRSYGRVIVDGSITHPKLGILVEPIEVVIEKGRIIKVSGKNSVILDKLLSKVNNEQAKAVAEFGIGLNPLASLCGSMLEDEGTLGTVHIGVGANCGIGGMNKVPFHLDMVIKSPTVLIDGIMIMKNGSLIMP